MPKTKKNGQSNSTESKQSKEIIPIRYTGIGSANYIKSHGSNGLFWYLADEGKIGVLDCTKSSTPKESIYDNKEEFLKFVNNKGLTIFN